MISQRVKPVKLGIVGSNHFGRYPKISTEETFNMIVSDGWLVPFAGYKKITDFQISGVGRGNYNSARFNKIIFVSGNGVYVADNNNVVSKRASIDTFSGDVTLDENNAGQIAICDKRDIYILDLENNSFSKASIDFLPGYVAFHNTRFVSVDLNKSQWRLSDFNNGNSWPNDAQHVGAFETKSDIPLAAIPFPGKGNLLFVFGSIVTESWADTGQQGFPYKKNTYFNMDYGCLSSATIAAGDTFVVWLGANEKSGPVIFVSEGAEPEPISDDGYDFKFSQLSNPEDSYGYLFKQDGHLIYVLTFPSDNYSLAYDFKTKSFYTLCDELMNYHIAKRVVYFNNSHYFVSFKDGNLYELNTKYTTYNDAEIPRIRVCPRFSLPDRSYFKVLEITFPIEQGESPYPQRIDFSASKDGGVSFSNYISKTLNPIGHRRNKVDFRRLGIANEFVSQFRFWSKGRFVVGEGLLEASK